MTGVEHGLAPTSTEPTPINGAPVTPPVEATLRILLNSVPFLMGVAVVRQPPAHDAAIVQVGRMPRLPDRRLTTLNLPDDALPGSLGLKGEPRTTLVSESANDLNALESAPRAEQMRRRDSVDLVIEEVRKSLADAGVAGGLGRILRDVMNVVTDASAFSVSVFH